MKGKKSFTAYCDWIDTFNELSDEEAGKLVKHLFRYVNDHDPEAPDRITGLLFAPIKSTLKRDLQKWLKRSEVNKENGARGGRPRKSEDKEKPKESEKTQSVNLEAKKSDLNQIEAKKAVRDSVRVRDSDSVREVRFAEQVRSLPTELPREEIEKFISHWTEKNPKGHKMRFEKEKTFDVKKRLATWTSNYHKWNSYKPNQISKLREL